MEIKEVLRKEREIWGNDRLTLPEIIVRMGKVFGDICKWERDAPKDKSDHTHEELKKEMGNIINSTIRWCDDLGYDVEECIKLSLNSHEKYQKDNKS